MLLARPWTTRALAGATVALAACGSDASGGVRPIGRTELRVDRGMASVRLGASQREVRRVLGAPDRRTTIGLGESGDTATELSYRRRRLIVDIAARGVISVETRSRRVRTAKGVGIGSRESAVTRTTNARCTDVDGARWCSTGAAKLGEPQTVFVFKRGRVQRVRVVTVTP